MKTNNFAKRILQTLLVASPFIGCLTIRVAYDPDLQMQILALAVFCILSNIAGIVIGPVIALMLYFIFRSEQSG